MQAYSMDLRKRVLEDSEAGMTAQAVAGKYRVSVAWVRRLKQRYRQSGELGPRPPINQRKPRLTEHRERLAELVRQQPDATLQELREQLGLAVGISTLWRTLEDLKLSFKKKSCTRPNKTART